MLNFYGLLYGIVLTGYALEIQERDTQKQGWNTKIPVKYNNMKSYQLCEKIRVFLIFSGSSPILKNNGISPKSLNIFPHFGKVAPLVSRFCTSISCFCHNYSIATAVKLQIKTESFHLLFTLSILESCLH